MTVNYIAKDKMAGKGMSLLILAGVLLFYVILFEFILPVNGFLPKPSILWESLLFVQQQYHLLANLLFTTGVAVFSIAAGYILLSLFSYQVTAMVLRQNAFVNFLRLFRYFPLAGIIALFVIWLPDYFFPEVIFSILFSAFYISGVLQKNISKIKKEYLDAASPLGLSNKVLYREIIWKSSEASLIRSFTQLYTLIWIYIVFFEFIKGNVGTGYVLRMCLQFNDLSGVVITSLLISVFILLGELLIRFIQSKLVTWEP